MAEMNNRGKSEIKTRKEYFEYVVEAKGDLLTTNNIRKQEEALKYALDSRKFEIDMYWKRGTYFWAFIAVSFTGYFALLNSSKYSESKYLLIIGFLGFLFSYSWYFVNRGSKFWQYNWERHVDYLENEIIGKLYKTVRYSKNSKFMNPMAEYPMSVSKINQLLSFIISVSWLFLIFDPLFKFCNFQSYRIQKVSLIEIVIFGSLTYLFYKLTRSQIGKETKNKDNTIFIIRDYE